MAAIKRKSKVEHLTEARSAKGRDHSPKWDGCETWDTNQFTKHFRSSMDWYRLESGGKELKPRVIDWMALNGYSKDQIVAFKKTKDWRCNPTMGAIASCLLRGMAPVREDFNNGQSTAQWLITSIDRVTLEGKLDIDEQIEVKTVTAQPNIQDRVRESSHKMTDEIEDAIESFFVDPAGFDPKVFKVINLLKGKDAKAAHSRIIKGFYARGLNELIEASAGQDEQLIDAYGHLSKVELKKIITFYQEIVGACEMLGQEAKVNRKPRTKKSVSKDKLISKLKFQKTNPQLKVVSIDPATIVGAKELWVYNTKSRKLGKYVADEFADLSIKGTSIIGFNETLSVQKTLRKPEEQLNAFKSAGKVQLRKFLDDIKAVDIKLNGRINDEILLLRVS